MNKTAMLKTLKCLLSILLSLVLISTLDTVIIKASFSETNQSNWKDKIDKELWAVMEAKSDSEIIPVYLWLDEIEEKFKNFFQTKVQVKHSLSNKGKIIVEYYSNEELDRILDIINRG